jgi:hypothetical protein
MLDEDLFEWCAIGTEFNPGKDGSTGCRTVYQHRTGCESRIQPRQRTKATTPTSSHHPHEKPLKVHQNASNRIPSLRPAAPVLMRFRPWRKFESKEPYIAGRCGAGTTARAGPKSSFFLRHRQHHSSGREKAASWAACAVAGAVWHGWAARPALPANAAWRSSWPAGAGLGRLGMRGSVLTFRHELMRCAP